MRDFARVSSSPVPSFAYVGAVQKELNLFTQRDKTGFSNGWRLQWLLDAVHRKRQPFLQWKACGY